MSAVLSAELSAELAADDAASDDEASFEEAVELVPFELHAVSVIPARAAVSINDKIFSCQFSVSAVLPPVNVVFCLLFIFLCSAPLVYGFYLFIYSLFYIQHRHIRPKRKFCRNSFMKSSDILYLSLLVYTFVCLACYQHTELLNKLYYDNREQNAYPHNIVIETLITE